MWMFLLKTSKLERFRITRTYAQGSIMSSKLVEARHMGTMKYEDEVCWELGYFESFEAGILSLMRRERTEVVWE